MEQGSWMQWLNSPSDNLKSKTCTEPRRSIENLKWVGIVAIGVTFAVFGAVAQAQQSKKVPRIGYLPGFSSGPTVDEFRQGLRDLGYIEGKNVLVE